MARISIVHKTRYNYRNPVGLMRHRLMVRPDDSHDLRLHRATLDIDPTPAALHWSHDPFNNSICLVEWPDSLRTRHIEIVSTLDLTHHPEGPPLPRYSLDEAAAQFPFAYDAEELPDLAPLTAPAVHDPEGSVAAWAQRFIVEGEGRTLGMLEAMTHAIRADFRYGARHEEGTQSAVQTLALGSGTCRDFAVLMIEALRSFGLAARFVTGYLYDDLTGETRGGGSTHAWCSVYLPGAGWVEYDPTNGLVAGSNLIRVGVTRTALQASPISGSFIGGADDFEGLSVDVAVTGHPISHGGEAVP